MSPGERDGAVDPQATAAADRLRRLLLRSSTREPQVQDLLDAAELGLEAGLRDAAAGLYGLAFLQAGFGETGIALRNAVDARTGLWGLAPETPSPRRHAFSVDAAIAELRPLLALAPRLDPGSPEIGSMVDDAVPARPVSAEEEGQALEAARQVAALLREVPRLQGEDALASALRREAPAVLTSARLEPVANVHQPVERLVALFVLEQMRRLLIAAWPLLFGAPDLYEAAGRLETAALGPYFRNVRLLIREADDVFALIDAASEAPLAPEQVETWAVLLSSGFTDEETLSLIDALADRGMERALRALLARSALRRRTKPSAEIAWRLRDAGLDLGSETLATEAQRLAIRWRPTDSLEWMTLGDILAAQGRAAEAEQAYTRSSAIDGRSEAVVRRLGALGTVAPRPLLRGIGTSPARYALRRARIAAHRPEDPPPPA